MTVRAMALAALSSALLTSAAGAQSLGEIAKKEADRRGTTPAAGKVFTNGDLKPDPTAPQPPPLPLPKAGDTGPEAKGAAAAAGENTDAATADADQEGVTPRDQQEPQASSDKGEEFWRGRANMHKARLAAKSAEIEALRGRLGALPPGGNAQERSIQAETLAKAVADLKNFTEEWGRFQQQARDRKVPDAWIR
jgi:hypothetical protein